MKAPHLFRNNRERGESYYSTPFSFFRKEISTFLVKQKNKKSGGREEKGCFESKDLKQK